jgi:hypothetical protein
MYAGTPFTDRLLGPASAEAWRRLAKPPSGNNFFDSTGAQAAGADQDSPDHALKAGPDSLKIGAEPAFREVVRVADPVTRDRPLAADLADLSHVGCLPFEPAARSLGPDAKGRRPAPPSHRIDGGPKSGKGDEAVPGLGACSRRGTGSAQADFFLLTTPNQIHNIRLHLRVSQLSVDKIRKEMN